MPPVRDEPTREGPRAPDRELRGALLYGAALAATAFLAYAFNALTGRTLSPRDFATFAALLGVLLALSGPVTALFGGAAMASARGGGVPRPRWRRWLMAFGVAGTLATLLPVSPSGKAVAWFGIASATWMLSAWNRGLLIGLGRLGLVGMTMVVEGSARIALALALVAAGWGVAGASAGLALGITVAFLLTEALLPRHRGSDVAPVRPEVWVATAGLLFLGAVQFADTVAVRLVGPPGDGPYAAASQLARAALYVQAPAAAYALRRAAVAGPSGTVGRALLLGLVPGAAVTAALLAFPGLALSATYGGRYVEATGLLRTLAVAMLLSGTGLVLVHLLMGAGRAAWAWSMAAAGAGGVAALSSVAALPGATATATLLAQVGVLAVAVVHARRLVGAGREAGGAVLFLNWRDTRHPQGGGSEVFVEEVARRLAASGRPVTIFCADHGRAPREEVVGGVRFVRRGSWRTVYLWAAVYHLLGRFGPHEVVVDVQNAVPFFSPLYCGRPVVVLVHHLHEEQWHMIFGPRVARAGWWVESWLAPRLYRRARYVAVSESTRGDLVSLGVGADRITVVWNGSPEPDARVSAPKTVTPTVTYLGRLVPHKRVELLLAAAARLRGEFPDLRVRILGRGPWEGMLRAQALGLGLGDAVSFEGFVDEATKGRVLAESWALALPSVKEGWGLAVMEAAAAGTPAVAFRVGGLRESIVDGETGLLAEDFDGFVTALRRLLLSKDLRARLGAGAEARARRFSWDRAALAFQAVLTQSGASTRPTPAAPVPVGGEP